MCRVVRGLELVLRDLRACQLALDACRVAGMQERGCGAWNKCVAVLPEGMRKPCNLHSESAIRSLGCAMCEAVYFVQANTIFQCSMTFRI